jgi:hypothetical protein
MVVLFNLFNQPPTPQLKLNYTEFLGKVKQGDVLSVQISGSKITGVMLGDKRFSSYAPDDPGLVDILVKNNVQVEARPVDDAPWYMTILVSWFPMLLLIGVWIFFMRQMQGGGGKAMSFGRSKAKMMTEEQSKITFADVAGAKIDNNEFDGQSLIAIQNDKTDRKYVYSQFGEKGEAIYMITSEQWKYIYSSGDDKEILFDKINDKTELFNIANTRTDVKEKIKQDLLNHFKNINYTDAFEEKNGTLEWKQYPLMDMSFLDNPDTNLLKQDYEPVGTTLPAQYS